MRKRVYIRGDVQGVGFRAACKREAKNYPNLKGYIRNLSDGRVEAVFEGSDAEVNAMVEWCRSGPDAANVKNVRVDTEFELKIELGPFEIR